MFMFLRSVDKDVLYLVLNMSFVRITFIPQYKQICGKYVVFSPYDPLQSSMSRKYLYISLMDYSIVSWQEMGSGVDYFGKLSPGFLERDSCDDYRLRVGTDWMRDEDILSISSWQIDHVMET